MDASGQVRITSGLLARNSAYNLTGQLSSAVISLLALPYVIPRLGPERYGIFALVWLIIEYFGVFEFGIGAATTKFVTEALGQNEKERIRPIFWTSLITVSVLGLAGFLVCLSIAPLFADRIFNISPGLTGEAKTVFSISAVLVITILVRSVLNGLLEAYQRFDLINFLRIPSNILTALIPLFVVSIGFGLRLIMLIVIIKEIALLVGYYWLCSEQMPRTRYSFEPGFLRPLLSFGGWLCLVRALGLLLLSLEPFLIGALVTVKAVTYYTIPYKVTGIMLMLPSSILIVLFPAFSLLNTMDEDKLKKLFIYSLKYIAAILGLPTIVLAVFSKEILILWLGADFEKSAMVMRLLAAGTLFGGISWLFGTLLTGTGHPKAPAFLGLLQAPLYILASWLLIKNFGINGAAAGWAAQKFVGTFLLYAACWKLKLTRLSWKINLIHNGKLLRAVSAILLILMAGLALKYLLAESLVAAAAIISLMVITYLVIVWHYVVDLEQKAAVLRKLHLLVSFGRGRTALPSVEYGRNEA